MVDGKKIKGYRDLTHDEITLINEIKVKAEEVGELVDKMQTTYSRSHKIDQRWLAIGTTQLQQGFMAITRAIAQPTTF